MDKARRKQIRVSREGAKTCKAILSDFAVIAQKSYHLCLLVSQSVSKRCLALLTFDIQARSAS
jgi:hypothetical protein